MTYPTYTCENGTQTGSATKAAGSSCANEMLIAGAVILTASVLLWVLYPILCCIVGVPVLVLLIAVVITVPQFKQVKTGNAFH